MDESIYLEAVDESKSLHNPWVFPPNNTQSFRQYLLDAEKENKESFFLFNEHEDLAGVFNLNDIVRGCFQSAFLGFYAMKKFSGKGLMSLGLKLLMKEAFDELGLHRIEANIQPKNESSICLIKKNLFKKEGFSPRYLMVDGEWRDHERWALTKEDYIDSPELQIRLD